MKKYLWICLAVVLSAGYYQQAKAQYYYDDEKKPIGAAAEIEGTPFESDVWSPGSAVDVKGTVYKNIKVKYDLSNDHLIFAGPENETMAFNEAIVSFIYNGVVYRCGFPHAGHLTDSTYYQVLNDGKTKLLKHHSKILQPLAKAYGQAVARYHFIDKTDYFILTAGKMTAVKPTKLAFVTALNDKSAQLNTYLAGNKIDFKNDTDMGKLVEYYNTL